MHVIFKGKSTWDVGWDGCLGLAPKTWAFFLWYKVAASLRQPSSISSKDPKAVLRWLFLKYQWIPFFKCIQFLSHDQLIVPWSGFGRLWTNCRNPELGFVLRLPTGKTMQGPVPQLVLNWNVLDLMLGIAKGKDSVTICLIISCMVIIMPGAQLTARFRAMVNREPTSRMNWLIYSSKGKFLKFSCLLETHRKVD